MKIKLNRAARRHVIQRIVTERNKKLIQIYFRKNSDILTVLKTKMSVAKNEKERKAILRSLSLKERALDNELANNTRELEDNRRKILEEMDILFHEEVLNEDAYRKFLEENDLLGWYESMTEDKLWNGFYPEDHIEIQHEVENQLTLETK